ncbi:MAG: zeta toxin family protein [Idiomarina sp.]
MTDHDRKLSEQANSFAKANRTRIARELTCKEQFPPDKKPVAVFMSGSPGAGKTEASKAFLEKIGATGVLRLDPDELRQYFPDYTGDNSYLFQSAVSLIIERTLDRAFGNRQSFLLDGTLSSLDVARKNISRALRKQRDVLILFVYQPPELAWEFVQAREKEEGRRILPETFIEQFLGSQAVVRELKKEFGDRIRVDLLIKANKGAARSYHDNIAAVENHLSRKYTRKELESLIL